MAKKSVKLDEETLKQLKELKVHPRETYDDVVQRLIKEVRRNGGKSS